MSPARPLFALTVQLREDVFGDPSSLDHVGPGEATVGREHSEVVHKLLVEALSLVRELGPREVTAEPLNTCISLKAQSRSHLI